MRPPVFTQVSILTITGFFVLKVTCNEEVEERKQVVEVSANGRQALSTFGAGQSSDAPLKLTDSESDRNGARISNKRTNTLYDN